MIKINANEEAALRGLPYLQRVLYYEGLRPYMDYQSGIVGIKRGISYQSLVEVSYVEPHRGYASGSASKSQIRRALIGLQKAGLISRLSSPEKLIFQCLLAEWDFSAQNKVVIKPTQKAVPGVPLRNPEILDNFENADAKVILPKIAQAVTPPESGNIINKTHINANFIFSKKFFEEAQAENLLDLDEEHTRRDFIAFHQSRGTLSCNWDAEYLRWLLKRKKYQQEENENVRKKSSSQGRSSFVSAVDIVRQAHAERLKKPHGRIIDGETDFGGPHCLALGAHD